MSRRLRTKRIIKKKRELKGKEGTRGVRGRRMGRREEFEEVQDRKALNQRIED